MSTTMNEKLAAMLNKAKASKENKDPIPSQSEEERQEEIAARALAAISAMGINPTHVLRAAKSGIPLTAEEIPEDLANGISAEELAELEEVEDEEEVVAAISDLLTQAGLEIEDDDTFVPTSDSELEEEDLQQLNEVTSSIVAKYRNNPRALMAATAQITSSLNVVLVNAIRAQKARRR